MSGPLLVLVFIVIVAGIVVFVVRRRASVQAERRGEVPAPQGVPAASADSVQGGAVAATAQPASKAQRRPSDLAQPAIVAALLLLVSLIVKQALQHRESLCSSGIGQFVQGVSNRAALNCGAVQAGYSVAHVFEIVSIVGLVLAGLAFFLLSSSATSSRA